MSDPTKWHQRFISLARMISTWSKDKSTKVGAVLVKDRRIIASGFNGLPVGVDERPPWRHVQPAKYLFTEHAERNCIYQAAKQGIATDGTTMYLMFGPGPCADCARAIIQAGVKEVVMPTNNNFPGKGPQWEESIKTAIAMLNEAGVKLTTVAPAVDFEV